MLSHQKQKKNRSGYEDGVSTLYKVGCRMRFDSIRFDFDSIMLDLRWFARGFATTAQSSAFVVCAVDGARRAEF